MQHKNAFTNLFSIFHVDENDWERKIKNDFGITIKADEKDQAQTIYQTIKNEFQQTARAAWLFALRHAVNLKEDSEFATLYENAKKNNYSLESVQAVAKYKQVELKLDDQFKQYTNVLSFKIKSTITKSDFDRDMYFVHTNANEMGCFGSVFASPISFVQNYDMKFFLLLIAMIYTNSKTLLNYLLLKSPELINADLSKRFGDSLLHLAIDNLNIDMVKFLIEKGANVNCYESLLILEDRENHKFSLSECSTSTPLHLALYKTFTSENVEAGRAIIEMLLQHGADPELESCDIYDVGTDSAIQFALRHYNETSHNQALRDTFDLVRNYKPGCSQELIVRKSADDMCAILGFRR